MRRKKLLKSLTIVSLAVFKIDEYEEEPAYKRLGIDISNNSLIIQIQEYQLGDR
jgi:hypothetical protein